MESRQKTYDFEERSFHFALSIRKCVSAHDWTSTQWTDVNQLLRSSGSVAANYIEANNSVSKADFNHRIAISKKEAAESCLWLRLLGESSNAHGIKESLQTLYREADEPTRILATILRNSMK
jgi:four helix bundle protein